MRAAVVADWGGAVVSPAMWEVLEEAATHLVEVAGLTRVDDVDTSLPSMGAAWGLSGGINIEATLREYWPECADVLTPEMRNTMEMVPGRYNSEQRAMIEARRMELNERMAEVFDPTTGVDFVITATNPDVAFDADGPLPAAFGGVKAGRANNGRLTFPSNLHGDAAISIPAGTVDGLPVGLQVVGRHYSEELLLDLALAMERSRPWPLVAPGSPV
jgi:aspartyl-tRNA(Asn)/glutamyl-tRNA(Gln) amidotransferase subunit A